jgi:hypothetical protein
MPHGFDSTTRPENTNSEEHNAVGDVSTGRRFKGVQNIPMKLVVDGASSTVTYLGSANWGTATSSNLWRILRISVSGTTTTLEMADGNDLFDNVFDDRASLSYS